MEKQNTTGVRHDVNFSVFHAGKLAAWDENHVEIPGVGTLPGKQFIKDIIKSTGCQISINSMPAGAGMPFHHAHKENEEIYIFLGGAGEMQIDGKIFPVGEGSIVRVAPNGLRCWRNNGTLPLTAIVIQVRAGSLRQHTRDDGIASDQPVVWAA